MFDNVRMIAYPAAEEDEFAHYLDNIELALALRPCGVTAHEAHSLDHNKISRAGYGLIAATMQVGEYVACVDQYEGDPDAVSRVWDRLPTALQDRNMPVNVMFAYARGGVVMDESYDVIHAPVPATVYETQLTAQCLITYALSVKERFSHAPGEPWGPG